MRLTVIVVILLCIIVSFKAKAIPEPVKITVKPQVVVYFTCGEPELGFATGTQGTAAGYISMFNVEQAAIFLSALEEAVTIHNYHKIESHLMCADADYND